MEDNEKSKPMVQVILIDEARIKDHLGEMVRGTVEKALNMRLGAEADQLCGAVATIAQKAAVTRALAAVNSRSTPKPRP